MRKSKTQKNKLDKEKSNPAISESIQLISLQVLQKEKVFNDQSQENAETDSPFKTNADETILYKEGTLCIEVIDTGIGISSDCINKLFKPFQSAGKDHHAKFGGTGLGLWISKVILDLMGATIECVSKEGEGTQFFIKIPVSY